jgi:hypothetical protein
LTIHFTTARRSLWVCEPSTKLHLGKVVADHPNLTFSAPPDRVAMDGGRVARRTTGVTGVGLPGIVADRRTLYREPLPALPLLAGG